MREWIHRHLERIVSTTLGLAVLALVWRVFARHAGAGMLEWAVLAWCSSTPIAMVWVVLRRRSLAADPGLRWLVVNLIVCTYLGIWAALTVRGLL